MKRNRNIFEDSFLNKTIKVLVIVLLLLLVIYMSTLFSPFWSWLVNGLVNVLIPVSFAWLLSLLLYPAIKFLEKRGIGPRWLSVFIIVVVIIVLLFGVLYYLIPIMADQIKNFFNVELVNLVDSLKSDKFRQDFLLGTEIYDELYEYFTANDLSSNVSSISSTIIDDILPKVASTLSVVAIAPFILLYYLLDYESVNDKLRTIIPNKYEKDAYDLAQRLTHTVGAYVRGQLSLMLAMGIAATFFYRLIDLEYFVIFGLIVGLTNIIPYFGAMIAAVVPVTFVAISGDAAPSIYAVLAINVGLQFVEGNVFQPLIMGRSMELHPLIILCSITLFGSLFGLLGVVFASPIASSIREIFNFSKEKRAERQKQIELDASNKI